MALVYGEHSVNHLAQHVGAQPAAVSQHLVKLRLARLVKVRREGNHMFYRAEDAHLWGLVEQALFHADHVTGGLAHHDVATPQGAPRPGRRA